MRSSATLFLAGLTLLSVLLSAQLTSCQNTYRAYQGEALPEAQVAIVRVQGDNGLVGALAQPLGGPHIVQVVAVDGQSVKGNNRNDFLPGTYTLRLRAEGAGIERDGYFETTQDMTVTLAAGETYWIEPRYSEHRPPWSFNLTDEPGGVPLATTEPTRADLDLLDLPPSPESLAEVRWYRTETLDAAAYVLKGETLEDWTRRLDLQSQPRQSNDRAAPLSAARERELRQEPGLQDGQLETDVLSDSGWIHRWTAIGKDGATRGMAYYKLTPERVYLATFQSRHEPTAEAECTEWEQRFLGLIQ